MKVAAFVPIKLNSQRLKNKNILPLGGKPLCWYITNTLSKVSNIDGAYLYCSKPDIMEYVDENMIFLQRSEKLDGDLVKGFDIYDAFINEVEADVYLLAHATAPFTTVESIQNALNKVLYEGYDSAFSAQKIQTFAWYNNQPINYSLTDVPRTQDLEPIFIETSAFFIFKKEIFTEYKRRIGFRPYIQEVNQMEAIDIDEIQDYQMAQKLLGDKV